MVGQNFINVLHWTCNNNLLKMGKGGYLCMYLQLESFAWLRIEIQESSHVVF